ncbi:MAG: RagB/SusD family nutrient uptake outer membrane protein [Candidatus Pedobacter colombiensis]|uniref:RagB/SusD family nutrient uptake outer membrane protein n=1 Tax=Candidatus Pedobacter colombiensis TaxID=3121371 RepID=A0AAJ5W8P1_9SPHI|nr:RagB/SusD family nutrient uptake outer membrane protein [Pedobacter sp.]WEK19243.1 MAG: RagB/SusD family nutrient uptake outer membrane protein [Pedobacter sp.]
MKRYIKTIAFLLMLGSTSCNKELDLLPITSDVETNFYKDQKDCLQGLVAAYNVLLWDAPQNQNSPFQLISEVLGDHCFTGGASVTDLPGVSRIDRGQIRPDDLGPKAFWYKYYTGIYRCNLLLEKMPNATFDTPGLRERFTAECKFLRAFYYFDLVRLFGNVPLILKTLAPSEYNQTQSSPEAVYAQISADLTEAINVLPAYKNMPPTELGRVTSDAARGLMMRVWLYYTGYYKKPELPGVSAQNILNISETLINNSGHDLLTNFADVFTPTPPYNNNNKESVFEIQYSSLAYSGNFSYREEANGNLAVMLWSMRDPNSASPYAAGWSFAPIDPIFYNQFDNTDLRKAVTFLLPKSQSVSFTPGYQNTDIFPQKWVALKVNNSSKGNVGLNYPNHFISIRFSDVLLMAAELQLLHGGSTAKAQQYFEKVAKRARPAGYVPPVVSLDVIYNERDLELALEGVRYWDLMRRGLDYAASKININRGEPFVSKFNTAAAGLFPIPDYEIILSKNTLVQNPGY